MLLYKFHLVFLRPQVTEDRDDPSEEPRGGAQPQRDQHEEEEDREELREEIKLGQGGGVADEGEAGPGVDHLTDRNSQLVSQTPEDGEDDEPGEEGGEGVGEADDESISVGVVSEVVVRSVGDESPEPGGEREEGLSDGSVPDLDVEELLPLRCDVEQDPVHSARQCQPLHQQGYQHDVREYGWRGREREGTIEIGFII